MNLLLQFFLNKEAFTLALHQHVGLLILRTLFGFSILINYGYPTLLGLLEGDIDYPDPLGLGSLTSKILMTFAEFGCSALMGLGLFTRFAAVTLVIGFGVAFFIFHHGDPFGHKELAYLYGSAALSVLLLGPGRFSIDDLLRRKTRYH